MVSNQMLASDANDQDKLMGMLCHLLNIVGAGWIVGLVILLTDMKNRPFQRFHAVNSIALNVVWIIIWVVLIILCTIISIVTLGLGAIGTCLFIIPYVAYLALSIWYGVLASQGNYFDIPFVTKFCRDQRWI
jgi:uncharacterized membrane protein